MPMARQSLGVAIVNDLIYAFGGSFPVNGFSTTASSYLNTRYTTLGNPEVTPVNFVPQEHCAVNEQYTPIGYGTSDEPTQSPSPPTSPNPITAPSESPTTSPEATPLKAETEPFPTNLIAVASGASIVAVGVGLFFYLKRCKQ